MKSDFHMHSSFSGDSDTPMKDMIERAIALGLETICFTEHTKITPKGKMIFPWILHPITRQFVL